MTNPQHEALVELLPCPFCGEQVTGAEDHEDISATGPTFYIGCSHCEYSLHETFVALTHKAVAIAAWNTRAALSVTAATPSGEVAELRRAAQAMSDFIGKSDMRVYATDLVVRELRTALEPQAKDL